MFYKRKTLCDIKVILSECKSLIWSCRETGNFCLCEINRGNLETWSYVIDFSIDLLVNIVLFGTI